jgi:hypothetical protein
MATGIIIHISVGPEKRTEFFSESRLSIGSDETCDLQIHTKQIDTVGVWLRLEDTEGVYRVIDYDGGLGIQVNGRPIRRYDHDRPRRGLIRLLCTCRKTFVNYDKTPRSARRGTIHRRGRARRGCESAA